jgi:hypothetical protein
MKILFSYNFENRRMFMFLVLLFEMVCNNTFYFSVFKIFSLFFFENKTHKLTKLSYVIALELNLTAVTKKTMC